MSPAINLVGRIQRWRGPCLSLARALGFRACPGLGLRCRACARAAAQAGQRGLPGLRTTPEETDMRLLDQGPAGHPRRQRRARHRGGGQPRSWNCVPQGAEPLAPVDAVFDASRHVVMPGLVNTHHHFFQTLTRAHPAGDQQGAVPLAEGALSDLEQARPRQLPPRGAPRADRIADVRLHHRRRPPLSLPARAGGRRWTSRSRRPRRSACA